MAATGAGTAFCFLIAAAAALLGNVAEAYSNHTVGGDAGWLFNSATNKTSANYVAWAANQTFNLGDFLIFNTTTNQTVIQTYNKTTYISCTMADSSDNDTFQHDGGSNQFDIRTIIAVPLTVEGLQYYFSGAQDGQQCLQGMAFQINVKHGTGLPPNLNQPPPPPYASPPTPSNDDGQQPTTIVTTPPNDGARFGGEFFWFRFIVLVILLLVI